MTSALLVVVAVLVTVWAFFVGLIVYVLWKRADEQFASLQRQIERARAELARH